MPAAHLERLTASYRKVVVTADGQQDAPVAAERDPAELRISWSWQEDGCLKISGVLSPEDGAALLAVAQATAIVMREVKAAPAATESSELAPDISDVVHRRHPANGMFSSAVVAAVAGAAAAELPRRHGLAAEGAPAEVVVHVDLDVLAGLRQVADEATGPPPRCHLEDAPAASLTLVERLACDGGIRLTTHGSDGRTLDLGRRTRKPSAAQRRALLRRDGCCAVPGCGCTRFLHAHHVMHWARGGLTNLDNLVLLCGEHHRMVHDQQGTEGFAIEALGRQRFGFLTANGQPMRPAPPLEGTADDVIQAYRDIDAHRIVPQWYGDRLDPDVLIARYVTERQRELQAEAQAHRGGGDADSAA